ncbi:uncharacterized protein [Procambarus clarkii]|uniref:uncharacterized protein n=1 Tax=Procambarus clarkii TaxID=6728 RepID=UPI0037427463
MEVLSVSPKMYRVWIVSLLALVPANGQEVASECPAPNGFFADARQCDKYYECIDNILTEKLCPDGMAFNDLNPAVEKCDLLSQVDCAGRPALQPPQPTEHCDRQNGNFAPKDSPNCQDAYRCVDGVGSLISCPEGLAFALETGICDWPDQSGRKDCHKENKQNFTCPKVGLDVAVSHPRYADPHDCQYFYVCINGQTPRRNGCAFGQVFNNNTTTCESPKDVPECSDYYTEYFDDYFATLEKDPGKMSADIIAAAIGAGYDVPKFRDRVRIQQGTKAPLQRAATTASPLIQDYKPVRSSIRKPTQQPQQRRPGAIRRKRPTTTTTTVAPDEYEYYYEYPEGGEVPSPDFVSDTAPAASNSVPIITKDVAVSVDSPADAPVDAIDEALIATDPVGTDPVGTDPVGTDPVATDPSTSASSKPSQGTRTSIPAFRRSFVRSGN